MVFYISKVCGGAMENDCSSCVLYSIRLVDVVVVYVVRLFCFFGCFIFTMKWFTINFFNIL
jgi:hypothetical protein